MRSGPIESRGINGRGRGVLSIDQDECVEYGHHKVDKSGADDVDDILSAESVVDGATLQTSTWRRERVAARCWNREVTLISDDD